MRSRGGRAARLNRSHCPDDRPLVAENMRRRLQGDVEEMRYEFRGLRKDGSVFPVEVHGRRIEHGGRIGVLGTLIDNTERRRAEDELRASEARFRTFVDHATDAFFLLDQHSTWSMSTARPAKASATAARRWSACTPAISMRASTSRRSRGSRERAGAGERITFETRHRRKDGTAFPVEIRTGTFQQAGQLFYLALARDISERKRAEESLRQSEAYLAEAQRLSHTGSWALDVASNRYVYTSEESDRIFGFDPQGEKPTREAVFERIHPEDRSSWKRNSREIAPRKGRHLRPVQDRAARRQGQAYSHDPASGGEWRRRSRETGGHLDRHYGAQACRGRAREAASDWRPSSPTCRG